MNITAISIIKSVIKARCISLVYVPASELSPSIGLSLVAHGERIIFIVLGLDKDTELSTLIHELVHHIRNRFDELATYRREFDMENYFTLYDKEEVIANAIAETVLDAINMNVNAY